MVIELERHVGVLRGVGQHFLRIHLTHRPLLPSLPDQLLDRDRAVPQQRLGEIVHPVTRLRIQQVVRQHRIPERRDGVDVVAGEELEVKLPIVRHLHLLRVGKKGRQGSQQLFRLLHLLRQGNVPRLMGSDGEGDPDEVILHAVQTVRLGVEGKGLGTGECLEESLHLLLPRDQGVAVLHRRDIPDRLVLERLRQLLRSEVKEGSLRRGCRGLLEERLLLGAEVQLIVDLHQPLPVLGRAGHLLYGDLYRHIGDDGDETA